MKKTLLFVTYGGGHAHMMYPVVHALHARADLNIKVLGLPAAKHTLTRNGVGCFGFTDYLDPVKDADAIQWGEELAKVHHSPTIGVERADSVAYLGLNYKDLVTRLGEAQAAALFKQKVRHAFYPLTIMERIFDDIRPDMVITSNSPRSEAAAIEVANTRGIPTLIMTDLFTGLGGYELQAKHITFLNAFAKDMFVSDGLVSEKRSAFYFTGNPAFDKILTLPKDKNPDWIRAHFPDAGDKPLILHADMPAYWHAPKKCSYNKSEEDILQEMEACYQAAMQNNAAYLIRPHPSQGRELYQRWLSGRKDAYLAAEPDLHELLAAIDLLIVRTTTVGLEASYMGKRILQLDADFHVDLPLVKMGIAWGVNSYGELPEIMKSALSDDEKLEKIREKAQEMLPNAPAAAKIADIILNILP